VQVDEERVASSCVRFFTPGMADGRVVRVPPTVSETSLRAAIPATGLDMMGSDWPGQPSPGGIPRLPGAGDSKAGGDAKSGGKIELKDYPKGKGR
jgi:hypothetical protein